MRVTTGRVQLARRACPLERETGFEPATTCLEGPAMVSVALLGERARSMLSSYGVLLERTYEGHIHGNASVSEFLAFRGSPIPKLVGSGKEYADGATPIDYRTPASGWRG